MRPGDGLCLAGMAENAPGSVSLERHTRNVAKIILSPQEIRQSIHYSRCDFIQSQD